MVSRSPSGIDWPEATLYLIQPENIGPLSIQRHSSRYLLLDPMVGVTVKNDSVRVEGAYQENTIHDIFLTNGGKLAILTGGYTHLPHYTDARLFQLVRGAHQ